MKILIAGDSFCNKDAHLESDYAWTRQLENMLPNSSVNCVGQGAASVFSALQQVKKQLQIDSTYDTVIVLITDYERLYQTTEPVISNLQNALLHKELYGKSNIKDERIFNKIEAVRMYYEFLYENELNVFISESCLKELQSLCINKRLILFPAFPNYQDSAFESSVLGGYGFSLLDICQRENSEFLKNFNKEWRTDFIECIALGNEKIGKINHMSVENQTMLARYFANLIQFHKSAIELRSFVVLPRKDFNLYYKPVGQLIYNGTNF